MTTIILAQEIESIEHWTLYRASKQTPLLQKALLKQIIMAENAWSISHKSYQVGDKILIRKIPTTKMERMFILARAR